MSNEGARRGRVIYNLDDSEIFAGTFGPVVPETLDQFVDTHAALGITDLFININDQRANFRSDAWEAMWDGYDPTAGDDQPFFAGLDPERRFEAEWIKKMLSLHEQGCDHGARMIQRARQRGVTPWISLRMNDSHYPDLPDHPYHSTIWREHPEWHLSNKGLDYEQPEVRAHHMSLVHEVCERYDLDGLELDFQRFWLYFRPGREHAGTRLMLGFMEEARAATQGAAERLGHPVDLAVRVPTTPWIARRHGVDAVAWARAGLVDLVVAGPFWPSIDSDVPIETWKGLLIGTDVEVGLGLASGIHPGTEHRTVMPDELRGVMVSALHRGADAIYFFNLFTGPLHYWPREDHDDLVRDTSSYGALASGPRRHALTISTPWAAGEPGTDRQLPFTGKHGVFRLHIGPRPEADRNVRVELLVPGCDQPPEVHLNGVPCPAAGLVAAAHIQMPGSPEAPPRQAYDAPPEAVADGHNLVEVLANGEVTITWVEISVGPSAGAA